MKTREILLFLLVVASASLAARGADDSNGLGQSFERDVKPFLQQFCMQCHNEENLTSGIRVDQLNADLEDRHLKLWGGIRHQIEQRKMPPDDEDQPSEAESRKVVEWISRGLDIARRRPTPRNGGARRLTVAQYRNTLRELLLLDDDVADILPPDAVSRDGFVNNQETLALSPLLLEAYFDIADKALSRCIVDPASKPKIQNFRMELGVAINREPCPDKLILGANSLLLNNEDFVVTQLTPEKPFAFEPFFMQTKYRFIEGYQGNDTVRGWRDFDSIYHSVFACLRGTEGYPKGRAYTTVPQGLLLRPAIPSAEVFGVESTYGPRANFKISLRELPDHGRFRVTVTAARYDDGLLLDPGAEARSGHVPGTVVCREPGPQPQTVRIDRDGIYQVDVFPTDRSLEPVTADASRLSEGLLGAWPLDGAGVTTPEQPGLTGHLEFDARYVNSPFGRAVALDGKDDAVTVPHHASMSVGEGDFTVAAWIHPKQLRQAGIVCLGKYSWTHGWYLDMPDNQGVLRIETAGPNNQSNGTVATPPGTLRANAWQHVAAVVKRGDNATALYVNGYPVAQGTIGAANLDNPKVHLYFGRIQDAQQFRGMIDEVRIYRRALDVAEIQALVEPGRKFVTPPPPEKPQELTLALGERQFIGTLNQPAFLTVRLPAGPMEVSARYAGSARLDRVVLTPLDDGDELARRFAAFERRSLRMGLHLGLRRDCGSTLNEVGEPQSVSSTKLSQFVYEGAIRNFPSPDVEANNVNYLAGIREIGVRSEYTDGRDMPQLLIHAVEFEGPYYDDWPPVTHRNIFVDFAHKEDRPAYAREIIRQFASRAYRRPVTEAEQAALVAVFRASFESGVSFEQSVQDALQVALASPQFLMLVESSTTPEPEPLDDDELASKLSYFLWNGPPDETLLKLAAEGRLRQELDGEVRRMVGDPRFALFVNEFTGQWLSLDRFAVLEPDRERFPKLTRDARAQLKREPAESLKYLIRENLPVRNLIESDFVVANEVVASYYDLAELPESGFEFVPVPHRRKELGGVLSLAAVMAGLSDGRESNPVKRGAWLARKIVAEPPDDPPPNVPTLPESTEELTLRQRLERHRNQPGCAQCHMKIDPWGVPLEEFDAGGRLKTQAVDARSELPDGAEVADFAGLRRHLADDRLDQVAFSVLKHLTIYGAGRSLTYNELVSLRERGVELRKNGYRMQDLLQFVVHSPMFLEK